MLVSRRRHGACAALRWDEQQQRYLCGLIADSARCLPRLPGWAQRSMARLAQRSIGVGSGCDAGFEVQESAAAVSAQAPTEPQ